MKEEVSELMSVKFEVKRISHNNPENGFSVVKVKFTEYTSEYLPTSEHIVVGNFASIFESDEFEAKGRWKTHDIYGYQFAIEWASRIVPQSRKGIQEFIKRFVKGIGSKTAERIVEEFGEQTLTIIETDLKRLESIKGLGKKRAKRIQESILKNKHFEDVAMFVLTHGGDYRTALQVYEAYGESAIHRVRENPYLLCTVNKITFQTADKFAKALGFVHDSLERIKEGILYYLDFSSRARGDLYVSAREIKETLPLFLSKQGSFKNMEFALTTDLINKAISELKTQEKIVVELNEDEEECVYLLNFHFIENRIVKLLKQLVEEPKRQLCTDDQIDAFIERYQRNNSIKFAEKQKEAIYMTMKHGISILTGGPGTGKTQTINSIIQCVQSVKPNAEIHLSAPTGKASKRMTELTGMDAQTIHRLIGLGFDDENDIMEVEGDLLVIDEFSMVDAFVCYKLLSAIQGDTRILFVGDHEQLPSVGAGLILRDLINSERIPTTKLSEIFRQAQDSQIVMNSHKVINGITTEDKDGIAFEQKKGDFFFIAKHDRLKAQQAVIDSVERMLDPKYGYTIDDIQILSPMRKGDLGVWILNKLMQERFNPRSISKREWRISEAFLLREGDKVIQVANNYELDVFNGEIGRVISIFEDDERDTCVEVMYDEDKTVIYDRMCVDELNHAWCLTIHKSQGSEYPVVIMPIHPSQDSMLNKNLVYTGLTRAKKRVVLIGSKESLNKAVKRNDQTVRNSLIQEKVRKNIAPLVK